MAIKRMQMYRRNLDGTETRLNPLTEAQYVSMENGQTVQEILSDRDSDKYTPVITNSSSTFKVGQGDNVDLSSSMKEGAYESCVLKGKTMVNCIQEPSSKDVVLPYEFTDGRYVTINDTKESGALGIELKGQTLVNVLGDSVISKSANSTLTKNGDTITFENTVETVWSQVNLGFTHQLKPLTKYLVKWDSIVWSNENFNPSGSFISLREMNTNTGCSSWTNGKNYMIGTTPEDVSKMSLRIHATVSDSLINTVTVKGLKVLEYQEGMENWDIPYFEGMTSCKMPTLSTKNNLFDGRMEIGGYNIETGTEENQYTTRIRCVDFIPINNPSNVVMEIINSERKDDIWIIQYDSNKNCLGRTYSFNIPRGVCKQKLNLNNNCAFIKFYEVGVNSLDSGIRYVVSDKTSILSLPEEIVLRSLPNGVCDTFNTRTGVYTQRIKEIVFDGSNDEGWDVFTGDWVLENSTVFCTYISGVKGYTWSKYTGKEAISDKIPSYPDNWLRLNDVLGMTNDNTGARKQFRIPKSYLETDNVDGFRKWLEQNPVTACFELATPIITKVNLSSTLKSWNTTTHIYSEIPENTLYPTLSHSNPSYPVILKPSTKYSIVANSYSNDHTNSAINFNLGGATASATVGNRVTTITTPSTLTNEELVMSGRGNKLNNVMVIEGDVAGDLPYFEGICDCKSPILSNVGKNLFNIDGKFVKGGYSYGVPVLNSSNQVIEKIGENSLHITCGTDFYHSGWGQIIDVKNLDSVTISVTSAFSSSLTKPELKVLCLYESEEVPATMDGQKKTDYDNRYLTQNLNDTNKTYTRTINTRGFAKVYVLFTGGYKAGGQGTFDFTLHNIYVGEESTHHGYEPYKSSTATFDQKDGKTIVLRSLPNGVCDTLNVETGEYVQRIGEKVFDGSNNGWQVLTYPPHDNDTHSHVWVNLFDFFLHYFILYWWTNHVIKSAILLVC